LSLASHESQGGVFEKKCLPTKGTKEWDIMGNHGKIMGNNEKSMEIT
jgi:hypothetical protein